MGQDCCSTYIICVLLLPHESTVHLLQCQWCHIFLSLWVFFYLIGPTCWSSDWDRNFPNASLDCRSVLYSLITREKCSVPHNEAPGSTANSLTWQHLWIRAPLRGEKCHKTLALNRKGVYPPEVYWVQSDCRDTVRGRGAHRPCRVQPSPQESRMFLVLFERCTGLQRWKIIICLLYTQLYGDWGCAGRDKTCGRTY